MDVRSGVLSIGFLVATLIPQGANDEPTTTPTPGVVLSSCRIDRVIDGDTVVLSRVVKFRVRLRDCWAPEAKNTRRFGLPEKRWGLESKEGLEVWLGKPCSLEIAFDGDEEVGDGLTFGRAVGVLYSDDQNLNQLQIEAGNAFATKAELHKALKDYYETGRR